MFIVLLCILFSSKLNFAGLTLIGLYNWFIFHPFLFLLAISEIFQYDVIVERRIKQDDIFNS